MKDRKITSKIDGLEYWLAKYKWVQERYPDASVHDFYSPVTFSSKLVNPKYTNFTISTSYSTLFIEPYLELEFEYKGKKEMLKIHTSPRRNRLAQIVYPRERPLLVNKFGTAVKSKGISKKIIRFTKFKMNMETRNLDDKCWHECRAAIMKYVQDNPGLDLDTKNLDTSLKKLMAFT